MKSPDISGHWKERAEAWELLTIDPARHQLIFAVEAASFPNWEGKTQVRDYSFKDGVLRYAVPASASSSGVVAYSVWRRAPE